MRTAAEFIGAAAEMTMQDAGLRFFPYTDSGNAERIAQKLSGSVRYCTPNTAGIS